MINLIKNRSKFMIISSIFMIFGLIMLFTTLNLGIDLTGWTQSEYSYSDKINLENIKTGVEELKENFNSENANIINDISAYKISWEETISIIVWFSPNEDEEMLAEAKVYFKDQLTANLVSQNESFKLKKYTDIWKSFWDYIKKTAYITLALALTWISIYIAYAFSGHISGIPSYHFWVATMITLLHDILICTGLYIFIGKFLPEYKIDTYFITWLLTILWYSINDTVVWFDRIRDNLKKFGWKSKNLAEIVDLSVNQTVIRSIFTSVTFVLVLVSIYLFGPETLKGFMLLLILWGTVWTYSSIFIASPLLYEMNKNKKLEVYKKVVISDEDKVVV